MLGIPILTFLLLVLAHHVTGHVCHVVGTSADCRGRSLTSVPPDLPRNLTSLDLGNNHIQLENCSFCHLAELTELFLTENKLLEANGSFPPDVFGPLVKLTTLDLSDNAEDCISYPPVTWTPMANVETLSLDLLSSSPWVDLSSFRTLTTLNLKTLKCTHSVSGETFTSLAEVPLRRLQLTGLDLFFLHRDALQPLSQHLQQLEMVDLPSLSLPDVIAALHVFQGRNMSLICLEGLSRANQQYHNDTDERHVINADLARIIGGICVTKVSLARNDLLSFDVSVFDYKSCLLSSVTHFDIHSNHLMWYYPMALKGSIFTKLEFLDISMHGEKDKITTNLFSTGKDTSVGEDIAYPLPPKLVYFNISRCTVDLGRIDVSFSFRNASNLRVFNISFCGVSRWLHPFQGLQNITTLDISGNDLSVISPNVTMYLPRLEVLSMRDSSLDPQFVMDHSVQFFGYLKNLESVDLSANHLPALPPLVLKNLREINLAFNSFKSVPVEVDQMPRLDVLDLTFNSIPFLSNQQRKQLDARALSSNGSFRLLLEGNPLSCDCSVLDFVSWLSSTSVRLDRGGNYTCVTDDGVFTTTTEVGANLDRKWRRCVGSWWLGMSSAWQVVTLMTLVLTFLLSRFWTNVQHTVLRMLGFGHALLRRADFRHDVYLAYSDADYRFACLDLLPLLEADFLRVYVRDRDEPVGANRAEEVVRAVGRSWRIVFLLTEAFLRDEWCQFTALTAARCAASPQGPGRVLLVLLQPLPRADLPPSLLTVVEEQDVLDLGGEHPGPALWGRFLNRLKAG